MIIKRAASSQLPSTYHVPKPNCPSVRPCSTAPVAKSIDLVFFSPWTLKGRTWIFALSGISKTASFPAGFADPTEAEALVSGGEFVGGFGMIQVSSLK